MLRDLALEAFEGVGEAESDRRRTGGRATRGRSPAIAKGAPREGVARLALERITDAHTLGSIARHAAHEADPPLRRSSVCTIAANCCASRPTANSRTPPPPRSDRFTDRADLEQIAARAKNKQAIEARARAVARDGRARRGRRGGRGGRPRPRRCRRAFRSIRRAPGRRRATPKLTRIERRRAARRRPPPTTIVAAALAARMALCDRLETGSRRIGARRRGSARAPSGKGCLHSQSRRSRRRSHDASNRLRAPASGATPSGRTPSAAARRLAELADEAVARGRDGGSGGSAPPDRRLRAANGHDVSRGLTIDPALAARYAEADAAFAARDAAAHEAGSAGAARGAGARCTSCSIASKRSSPNADLTLKAGRARAARRPHRARRDAAAAVQEGLRRDACGG